MILDIAQAGRVRQTFMVGAMALGIGVMLALALKRVSAGASLMATILAVVYGVCKTNTP
jgi:hypothetical protein